MSIAKRVSKKDGRARWQVLVDVEDASGKRKRRVVGTYATKKAAEKAERDALTHRDAGTLLDADSTTVAELLDTWLADKAGTVTSNTVADYRSAINKHLNPALGTVPIRKLTAATLQAQYATWRDAGLSPRMIRGAHMRLNQAFDHAVRLKLVLHNPVKDTTPPKLPRTGFDHWNADESRRFLDAAQFDTYAPLWDVLLREGLRRGEALGLRWRDVNWNQGTVHIQQSVIHDKANRGGILIQPRTKTRAGARTVRLTGETIAALKAHRLRWTERQLAASQWRDTDLIFCTRTGGPVNPANIARNFNAITKAAGLRRIKVHELRHTAASLMLLAGVPAKVVSERLGHASIGITLDTYSHVLPSMQDDAAAAMSRILSG